MKVYIKSLISIFLTSALILDGQGIILINKSSINVIYEKDSLEDHKTATLKENDSVFLGNIGQDMLLSIKKAGTRPLFKDLSPLISVINAEALLYPNRNAIITIHFKRIPPEWKVDVSWKIFNMYDLLQDSLGEDYAQKAREIELYDYSKSIANGFVNLFDTLSEEINNLGMQPYKKSPRRRDVWIAPDESTIEDLKNSIDRLYRALQKYKARDSKN
jgi:hypothetical protein